MIVNRESIAGIGFTSQRTRSRMIRRLIDRGIRNDALLQVMNTVPRHLFVDEAIASRAYEDTALPIGEGQSISQPYVVARMSEILLADGPLERVLEIGTGSGYQTAILSQLVHAVFTVERIRVLLERARKRFRALHYHNIHSRYSDGGWGWSSQGPFDAIIVTAAPQQIPKPLMDQLAIGGRMVVPVGEQNSLQSLTVLRRTSAGLSSYRDCDVRFVPFLAGKS